MIEYSKICVIGLGYIGLPTAALFASKNIKVIGVEINESIVNTINFGQTHIEEPNLSKVVKSVVKNKFLKASAIAESSDAFIITVPTPLQETNKQPDLTYVRNACLGIAKVLKPNNLVVLESTSPVGTTEEISKWMSEERPDLTFPHTHGEQSEIRVAYCPERVLPGNILQELEGNDRILGGISQKCSHEALKLYKLIVKSNCFQTDARTAEMTKLTENSFRDINIAFANELSMLCDKLKINVWDLIELANYHPRVNILKPGPGVGGHCIAIDPWFLVSNLPKNTDLIKTARLVNDQKPFWVIKKIKETIYGYLKKNPQKSEKEVKVGFFGLSYKPDVSDLRESPSIIIINKIMEELKVQIIVAEPNIRDLPETLQNNTLLTNVEDANFRSDIKVILVNHRFFFGKIKGGIIVDTCGFLNNKTN